MTAAISFEYSAKSSDTDLISLNWAIKVSFAVPLVTPAELGSPSVRAPDPAAIRNESPCP